MKIFKFFKVFCVVLLVEGCSENTDFLPQKESVKVQHQIALRSIKLSFNKISSKKWLKVVPDNVYISQLSIPGTHESSALYEPLPNIAKCQDLDVDKQLEIGVRYLDIRCRHFKNKFAIHHGPIYQHKNFSDILQICKKFLKENPSEFIIMSVKQEYNSANNNRSFYQTFTEYIKNEANDIFYTKNAIPTVAEVRGKIILIRRFKVPVNTELGIQAYHGWKDNRKGIVINNGVNKLIVQDKYKFEDNNLKWNLIVSQFKKSVEDKNPKNLYINNTSGYKPIFWFPNIKAVSNQINNRLGIYLDDIKLSENKEKKLGIIGVDFITPQRAKQIYTIQNF